MTKPKTIEDLLIRIKTLEDEMDSIESQVLKVQQLEKACEYMAQLLAEHLKVPVSSVWWNQ